MLPSALKSLFASEKGFAGGMLIIAATVFVFTGRMTVDAWTSFCTWVFTAYVAGKTIQGGITSITDAKISASVASAPATSSAPAPDDAWSLLSSIVKSATSTAPATAPTSEAPPVEEPKASVAEETPKAKRTRAQRDA